DRQHRDAEAKEKTKEKRESVTFGHFFENQYLPTAKLTKKEASCKAEENYFGNWIKPVIGDRPFKNIMPLQIEKIKQNLLKAGRSPRTIEYIFAIIRQVWNMAYRDGLIDRACPTVEVKKPKISNGRQRFLSRDEAEKLLEAVRARSEQTYKFCLLSLYCGLRAGEIFNLKWQDIDQGNGMIRVADGKGDKSRYAYMTEKVKEMFSEMHRGKPDDFVFKNRKGGKVDRISHAFQRAVTDLELNEGVTDSRQKVVFHTLRHTFASWLVEAGTDLYVVQKLMGHASFEMVQRYSHLGENALQAAVKRLEPEQKEQEPAKVVELEK
ncbi:MAG: site-specific integrase, partial [Desulfobacteraceae bacterium]|nr:site-specific integrase [Desulfobacteraceae bacterium]